jgi:hypothetical protein
MKNYNALKVILAVILFICLFDMPYEYYQFVRIAMTFGFSYLAYSANKLNKDNEVIPFIVAVMVFQPFATVNLSKIMWNVIDVIIGVSLLTTLKQYKK